MEVETRTTNYWNNRTSFTGRLEMKGSRVRSAKCSCPAEKKGTGSVSVGQRTGDVDTTTSRGRERAGAARDVLERGKNNTERSLTTGCTVVIRGISFLKKKGSARAKKELGRLVRSIKTKGGRKDWRSRNLKRKEVKACISLNLASRRQEKRRETGTGGGGGGALGAKTWPGLSEIPKTSFLGGPRMG